MSGNVRTSYSLEVEVSCKLSRFLIAALHVHMLQDCVTLTALKKVANARPTDLKTLYQETIERIRRMGPDRARIGLLALLWATHAKQPLHIDELGEALGTSYTVGSFELGHFDRDAVPEKNVILACTCGLLTVDASSTVHIMRESVPQWCIMHS